MQYCHASTIIDICTTKQIVLKVTNLLIGEVTDPSVHSDAKNKPPPIANRHSWVLVMIVESLAVRASPPYAKSGDYFEMDTVIVHFLLRTIKDHKGTHTSATCLRSSQSHSELNEGKSRVSKPTVKLLETHAL